MNVITKNFLLGFIALFFCGLVFQPYICFGGTTKRIETSLSFKNIHNRYGVENVPDKESTKRTVFVLLNHGKESVKWGISWFFKDNYHWSTATNDFLKGFSEIIAFILSVIVFFFEFGVNVLVYYFIGASVALYGVLMCIIGILLIPIIAIWNFFLWIVNTLT